MKNILSLLVAFLFSIQLFAQAQQLYPDDEMVIIIRANTSQEGIDSLLDYLNMHIIDGPTLHTRAALLRFNESGAPGWSGNNPIDSINGVVEEAVTQSKVDGAGLNYELVDMSYPSTFSKKPPRQCRILNPNTQPNGGHAVKTAIFDTGITDVASIYGNFFDPQNLGFNYIFYPGFDPIDDHNHGTHISSIVMRNLENENGMIALSAYKTHTAAGTGELFDVIKAIDKAITENVQIINMSFSFYAPINHRNDPYAPLRRAIGHARDAGILCVASAGNHNINNDGDGLSPISAFPASYDSDNIISVASANCKRIKSSWSNYGEVSVDVVAPGENILGFNKDGQLMWADGTSQATAFVTKLASYLASHQSVFDWEATKCAILTGVIPLNGEAYVSSNGYINSVLALDELLNVETCGYNTPPGNFTTNESDFKTIKELRLVNRGDIPSFEISTDIHQQADIIIVNVLGEIVFNQSIELEKGKAIYDLDFPKDDLLGVYFLSVRGDSEMRTLKFVR